MMTVYADYAAAAPLRPEARTAMLAALDAGLGNPSSVHAAGARARARLEAAREEVAAALGVHPLTIVFTSGATEANNLALVGIADAATTPSVSVALLFPVFASNTPSGAVTVTVATSVPGAGPATGPDAGGSAQGGCGPGGHRGGDREAL